MCVNYAEKFPSDLYANERNKNMKKISEKNDKFKEKKSQDVSMISEIHVKKIQVTKFKTKRKKSSSFENIFLMYVRIHAYLMFDSDGVNS